MFSFKNWLCKDIIEENNKLREDLHFKVVVLQSAMDAVITINTKDIVVEWEGSATKIFQYSKEEAVGSVLSDLIVPLEYKGQHSKGIKRFLETGEGPVLRKRIEVKALRKDRTKFDAELTVSPIMFRGEQLFTARVRDISEQKELEEQKETLVNELNHRVRNTLTTVRSIVKQSFAPNKSVKDIEKDIADRILALGRAHETLTKRNWDTVNLIDIIQDSILPFNMDGQFDINGPDIELEPTNALTISMILHELSTNAVKYGSLSTPLGIVELNWVIEKCCLRIHWKERNGPPVIPPSKKGFGSKLISRSLSADMCGGAEIRFDPDGVYCSIGLKLPTQD